MANKICAAADGGIGEDTGKAVIAAHPMVIAACGAEKAKVLGPDGGDIVAVFVGDTAVEDLNAVQQGGINDAATDILDRYESVCDSF